MCFVWQNGIFSLLNPCVSHVSRSSDKGESRVHAAWQALFQHFLNLVAQLVGMSENNIPMDGRMN